ncbi:hypothetical protein HH303_09410 [Rhodospirillaceae bacterium KN72]|uniref:Uncharacterized protein n=1 Tax=Pacificispira spongiicola TaxID=2729598 RepID=A0A7Y0DZY6_9PROT|nr:hypothetical protein [Pacificispira spongiicola]NMM44698.1 hypothetical protein [Pacificispira spongiicola]
MSTPTGIGRHRFRGSVSAAVLAGLALGWAVTGGAAQDARADGMAPKACYLHTQDGSATPDDLEAAYDCFEEQLLAGYAQSKHILAKTFGGWERAGDMPFVYDAVGDRYLVAYGNERAVGEESTLWLDRGLPVGATVAVAGFTVDENGMLHAAPLMIYEKMSKGYTFGRGNWRQTMIAEDGAIVGVTKGPGAEELTVCEDCAARSADRLYLALMHDGRMPADAPEESAPIQEDGTMEGETLDPGAVLSPAPLDPSATLDPSLSVPPAENFDPNASLNNGMESETLAPLDPMAPLDPLAPLEPNAPSTGLDPAAPLDPLSPLDPLAPLEPDATSSLDDNSTAMAPEEPESMEPTTDSDDNLGTDMADAGDADIGAQDPAANNADILSGLALELADAVDPLLEVPVIGTADAPPFLELPEASG